MTELVNNYENAVKMKITIINQYDLIYDIIKKIEQKATKFVRDLDPSEKQKKSFFEPININNINDKYVTAYYNIGKATKHVKELEEKTINVQSTIQYAKDNFKITQKMVEIKDEIDRLNAINEKNNKNTIIEMKKININDMVQVPGGIEIASQFMS
jgi:hypothetical protein